MKPIIISFLIVIASFATRVIAVTRPLPNGLNLAIISVVVQCISCIVFVYFVVRHATPHDSKESVMKPLLITSIIIYISSAPITFITILSPKSREGDVAKSYIMVVFIAIISFFSMIYFYNKTLQEDDDKNEKIKENPIYQDSNK